MTEFEMTRGFLAQTLNSLHAVLGGIGKRISSIGKRRRFKSLLDLDDRMLDDMGVHRHEVDYVSRLPLSVDAATELRRISLERRSQRM